MGSIKPISNQFWCTATPLHVCHRIMHMFISMSMVGTILTCGGITCYWPWPGPVKVTRVEVLWSEYSGLLLYVL